MSLTSNDGMVMPVGPMYSSGSDVSTNYNLILLT